VWVFEINCHNSASNVRVNPRQVTVKTLVTFQSYLIMCISEIRKDE